MYFYPAADMQWTSTPAPYVVPQKPIASDAQISGLLAQIATTATDTHFIACGSGRNGASSACPGGVQFVKADNTEMHEVACCSDTPLDGFSQRPGVTAQQCLPHTYPVVTMDQSRFGS